VAANLFVLGKRLDCKDYRLKYSIFTKFPLAMKVYESKEYELWQEHGFECESCKQWDINQQVIARGLEPTDFPCLHIAYYSTMPCDIHNDPWECPEMTIVKTSQGYGIPVRDGGSSYISISYCPWCGIRL
jgi:hypothetical protein